VELRREAERFLPEVCVVQTPTDTRNAEGEYTKAYATSATVACRVAPSSYQQAERAVGAALAAQASWAVTLPAGTSVPADGRVVVNGVTYDVVGSTAGRSNEVLVRAYCSRRNA